MEFPCSRCGTPGSIELPLDGTPEVTCRRCGARQPRSDYDVLRVRALLSLALARKAREPTAAIDSQGSDECPSCGAAGFEPGRGCAECRHGRPGLFGRAPTLLYALAFLVPCGLGLAACALVGVRGNGGILVNLAFIVLGAALAPVSIRFLRDPTSAQLVDIVGHDASGLAQYGNARSATEEQGRTAGAVLLLVSLVLVAIGVFVGLVV